MNWAGGALPGGGAEKLPCREGRGAWACRKSDLAVAKAVDQGVQLLAGLAVGAVTIVVAAILGQIVNGEDTACG